MLLDSNIVLAFFTNGKVDKETITTCIYVQVSKMTPQSF